ncbi:PREDICTED: PRUPE_1G100600 [Prunus dulcis]|uniref:PREDICTED: PRUPE_1G100600 n=1 Tax=Prunus dulcis TaxID=3755 RepID=A0A5E4ER04_PRUDU|nr:PREDICTED: PRUPE_1G100600 [Prunus dulcis]
MASNFAFCYLLLLLSSTLFITIRAARPYEQPNQPKPSGGISVDLVSSVLSDKGYHAMSLTLEAGLEALTPTHFINHNTTLTLFCPQDQAFLNFKYPRPPLTLLRYHVVPFKIDKEGNFPSWFHG